jgi:hypothetical protein
MAFTRLPSLFRFIFAVSLGVWSSLSVPTTRADEPASLALVPADASFYAGATHLREQYDAFIGSRAVAKLREMPIVQMGLALAQAKWNDPQGDFATAKALLEQPENKQLVELLIDAVSHEVFIYGDEGFADVLGILNDIQQANQAAASESEDSGEQLATKLSQILVQHLEAAKVPDTVIGFRLSDTDPAVTQLARLEQLLGTVLAEQPDLKQRLSRQKIAGGDFLTMELDGSLIPWEAIAKSAEFDLSELRDKVSKMTASVAIGVRDKYLIISIGDNNEHLALLGQGDVLANRKELAPVRQHSEERLCSVSYASETFMKQAASSNQRLDQLESLVTSVIQLAELEASLQEQLLSDTRDLIAQFKESIPEPGAVTTFAFTSNRGYEGYSYNWGENKGLDATQPLTVLDHLGGDPILLVAGRGTYSPENYETFSKWIGRAIYYGETIGLANLGSNEQDFYQRVRGDLASLLKQLDQINRDKVVPAFRDGQMAVVLDAKVTSTQWHELLAPTDKPLPMLELGLVCGVSDANLLREAAADYFRILQKAIDTLHDAEPTTIPEYQLPLPDSREFPEGTVYYYRLPREFGLDKQFSPNAGLSIDTLVLSLIPKTTVRLLGKKPYQAGDVIGRHPGAAGAAMRFSLAGLIDAVAPWVDYGVELSGEEVDATVLDQVHTGLEIAKCLRGISTITYQENDAWVTHFEMHLEDLQE